MHETLLKTLINPYVNYRNNHTNTETNKKNADQRSLKPKPKQTNTFTRLLNIPNVNPLRRHQGDISDGWPNTDWKI